MLAVLTALTTVGVVAVLTLVPSPAAAHSCAAPVRTEVGETTSLTIGVAAELEPLVAIDVEVPDGFTLTGPVDVPQWQAAAEGGVVHFTGGRVTPFGCGYVTVRGRAERKGRLLFPVTVTAEDGTTKRYAETDSTLPTAGGLLYVGVDPPRTAGDEDGGGAGIPWAVAAGVGALAIAGITVGWRRRPRAQTTAPRAGRAAVPRASGPSRPGTRKRRPPRRR